MQVYDVNLFYQICLYLYCFKEEEDEPDISNGDEGGSAIFDTLHKKVRVVRDAVLPISIVDFLATFVEDSAPHSYQK